MLTIDASLAPLTQLWHCVCHPSGPLVAYGSNSGTSSSSPLTQLVVKMSPVWSLERGANVRPNGVHFSVWAPTRKRVRVRVTNVEEVRRASTSCALRMPKPILACSRRPSRASRRERTTGSCSTTGKASARSRQPMAATGVHGPSRVVDPKASRGLTTGGSGITMQDLVIYELHVGTFTPEGTLRRDHSASCGGLKRELGVTAIEIMPVAQFPGERNWGYDGVDLYAAQNSYGGPEGLQAARRCRARGRARGDARRRLQPRGPGGQLPPRLRPLLHGEYQTPWGRAVNYDDTDSDEVRRSVIDNALYWMTEFHVDGLRLDAMHGIFDFSAHASAAGTAEAVHDQAGALGRTSRDRRERSERSAACSLRPIKVATASTASGATTFITPCTRCSPGRRAATTPTSVRRAMLGDITARAVRLRGSFSPHRSRRHGGKSAGLPRRSSSSRFRTTTRSVIARAAIGCRPSLRPISSGSRRRSCSSLPTSRCCSWVRSTGRRIRFSTSSVTAIRHWSEAVREGRRKEFEAFGWGDDVPDPQSEETFHRSRLDLGKLRQEKHARSLRCIAICRRCGERSRCFSRMTRRSRWSTRLRVGSRCCGRGKRDEGSGERDAEKAQEVCR